MRPLDDLSVIVPVRNAEAMIDDCLAAIVRAGPREIIVVDGNSTDSTVARASRYPVRVMSDDGRGVAAARLLGVQQAAGRLVALIDVDVVLHDGALEALVEEFQAGDYTGLQAGLHSVGGPGYWGRALAHHHRTGRSRDWFGVVATVMERETLLAHGFDETFESGEDVDLRWRLRDAGGKLGVSRETVVEHRFGDGFEFAKGQWLADGHGLGRMALAHGLKAKILLGLPLAAGVRGIGLSLVRLEPQWIPYFLAFIAGNYVGIGRELAARLRPARAADPTAPLSMTHNALTLVAGKAAALGLGFLFWVLAARLYERDDVGLAAGAVSAMMLCVQLALMGIGSSVISSLPTNRDRWGAMINTALSIVGAAALVTGTVFLVLAGGLFGELDAVGASATFAALYLIAVVTGTLGVLLDQISTALRRGDKAMIRNLLFGVTSLVVLVLAHEISTNDSATLIFLPWTVSGLLVCALGAWQLRRAVEAYRPRPTVNRAAARELFQLGLPNWALTFAERAPGLLLPLVVVELASPGTNAVWYLAWMMAWVVYVVPVQVGMSLFAEISHEPDRLAPALRRAAVTALGLGVAGAVCLAAAAHPLLSIVGGDYATGGADTLRILVLAILPLTVTSLYYSVCRATRRLAEGLAVSAVTAVAAVAIGAAVVGAGLESLALAWLLTQTAAACVAAWRLRRLQAIRTPVGPVAHAPTRAETSLAS